VFRDQTALGLIVRMMAAGIVVRVLLWMPTTAQAETLSNQADEEWSIAAAIQDYNTTLQQRWRLSQPIGVVGLDLRSATPLTRRRRPRFHPTGFRPPGRSADWHWRLAVRRHFASPIGRLAQAADYAGRRLSAFPVQG
jgi:hypothetical protein